MGLLWGLSNYSFVQRRNCIFICIFTFRFTFTNYGYYGY